MYEQSSSSSRESMFTWPFSLVRIPSWKHPGLGSWEGSWHTPNNKYLLYKHHAWNFLHMNKWHSHGGWERLCGGMRPQGSRWYLVAPEAGSNVKVVKRGSSVPRLSVYLDPPQPSWTQRNAALQDRRGPEGWTADFYVCQRLLAP